MNIFSMFKNSNILKIKVIVINFKISNNNNKNNNKNKTRFNMKIANLIVMKCLNYLKQIKIMTKNFQTFILKFTNKMKIQVY